MLCTPRRPLHLPASLSLRKFFVSIRCRNEIFTYLCNISSRNCKTSKHYVTIQPIPLDIHGRRAARASAPHTPRRTRHGRHDLYGHVALLMHKALSVGIEGAGHQLFVPHEQPLEIDRRLPAQALEAGHRSHARGDVHHGAGHDRLHQDQPAAGTPSVPLGHAVDDL